MKTCTKKTRFSVLTFITITLLTPDIHSQVTIGLGAAPAKAGLLQLKDQEPDNNNVTSKTGGLILPRVALVDPKTLEPFINPTEVGYSEEKIKNVGLLVYNMSKTSPFVQGLYCWNGETWDILKFTESSSPGNTDPGSGGGGGGSADPETPTSIYDPLALKLPNSYIAANSNTIDIPVIKAYSVWTQMLNIDEAQMEGAVSAELLWQDREGLIEKVTLANGDKGTASKIRVVTNSNGKQGNAVVQLKINNIVRWSWHIWVTSYNPNVLAGEKICNSKIFMDRNLGALTVIPGSTGTSGLLYQWGRKDPFPGSATVDCETEKALYSLTGETVSISKKEVQSENNLSNATTNPLTFYYSSTSNQDWYSTSSSVRNDHLWNESDGTKGVFDPCPKGWRVPKSGSANASIWYGLTTSGINYDKGKGEDWGTAGYYPAAGYRNPQTGDLKMVGVEGYVWAASEFYGTSYRLWFKPYYTQVDDRDYRAKGNSVRCVKE
ncbi:hypothetical protein JGH11_13320 [Dysgonomonas sp. Marseille-P4677]|uniref:hypothetical protein n=1 Tax=Dysgonomonas sp. Marseille-P4677 TaxID=2364790 RepID=UPI001912ABC3|nr:hypothetical protein [Dysgonomonas sp. Marseille-P4677]MBK5721854.1 hypothetical protein [Dysgonomonas sp. Marseille-P4677]